MFVKALIRHSLKTVTGSHNAPLITASHVRLKQFNTVSLIELYELRIFH